MLAGTVTLTGNTRASLGFVAGKYLEEYCGTSLTWVKTGGIVGGRAACGAALHPIGGHVQWAKYVPLPLFQPCLPQFTVNRGAFGCQAVPVQNPYTLLNGVPTDRVARRTRAAGGRRGRTTRTWLIHRTRLRGGAGIAGRCGM